MDELTLITAILLVATYIYLNIRIDNLRKELTELKPKRDEANIINK